MTQRAAFGAARILGLKLLGLAALGLGIAGLFLPLLPTTVFLLIAAWAFARSSPRLDGWMRNHPRLGPPLKDWEERGAIPRRAKVLAVAMMATSWGVLYFTHAAPIALIGSGVVLACVATYVVTRPA